MVTGTIWQGNNRAVASFPFPDIDSPDKSFPKGLIQKDCTAGTQRGNRNKK